MLLKSGWGVNSYALFKVRLVCVYYYGYETVEGYLLLYTYGDNAVWGVLLL